MKYLALTTIILILISCTKIEDTKGDSEKKLSLSKIEQIVLENEEPLFGRFLEIIKVSDNGDFFMFNDLLQQKVYVFDEKGNFINRIGETGKGPKGIVNISGFDFINGNEIFIYDSSQRMFKTFHIDGSLKKTVSFKPEGDFSIPPFHINYYNNNIFTPIVESAYIGNLEKSKLIAKINLDGKVDTLFGRHDEYTAKDNHYVFKNILTIDNKKERIYVALPTSPFIQEYDLKDYSLIKYFGEKTESHRIPENEITRYLPISEVQKRANNTSSNFSIHTTTDYIILHRQILTSEWMETSFIDEKENIILIYNKSNYELEAEMKTNHLLGAVRNNKLYFIEDFNPDHYTIGIYELIKEGT